MGHLGFLFFFCGSPSTCLANDISFFSLYCVVSSTRPKQEGAGRATLVLIPNDLQLFACPGGGTGGGIEAGTTKEETRERRGIQCTNSTTSNLIGQLYPGTRIPHSRYNVKQYL